MLVDVIVSWIRPLNKNEGPANKTIQELIRWKRGDNQRAKIDLRMLTAAEIEDMLDNARRLKGNGHKALEQAVENFRLLRANPSGLQIKLINELTTALIAHFKSTAPSKWVFIEDEGQRVPYYVHSIEYTPPQYVPRSRDEDGGYTIPAHVDMKLKASGMSHVVTWRQADLDASKDHATVPELLADEAVFTETSEMVERFKVETETWAATIADIGGQYNATGKGRLASSHWYSSHDTVDMEYEGERTKVVVDDGSEANSDDDSPRYSRSSRRGRKATSPSTTDNTFWLDDPTKAKIKLKGDKKRHYSSDDDEDEASDDNIVVLPVHPWVPVFDLRRHQFVDVHINNLEPYKYDTTVEDKLVLPENTLDVLYALIRGADEVMEDIVQGKTGGTIVIATGPPGTGKTLTAELFSEIVKKPLYNVQCSQLGTSGAELEKQLGIVLARATRWKALLLIDEADVYVRARGDDIEQNAIVGIWLRVLEYYRGVLFMTSNKATMIDDAVMSRATAWIRYELPSPTELAKIWNVLGAQYGMNFTPETIDELLTRWPRLSGRNVKNMIKLAQQLRKTKKAKTYIELFERVAGFLDIPKAQTEEDDEDLMDADTKAKRGMMKLFAKLVEGDKG